VVIGQLEGGAIHGQDPEALPLLGVGRFVKDTAGQQGEPLEHLVAQPRSGLAKAALGGGLQAVVLKKTRQTDRQGRVGFLEYEQDDRLEGQPPYTGESIQQKQTFVDKFFIV